MTHRSESREEQGVAVESRLFRSLHFKIAFGVIVPVVLLAGLDLALDYRFYRHQLVEELQKSAQDLSRITLEGLLKLAMLGQHPELLQDAIVSLGKDPPLLGILLLDRFGQVRFSSDPGKLGQRFTIESSGCRGCHQPLTEPLDSIFYEREGEQVFRTATVVPNRRDCHACHDPDHRINGILVIDFSTKEIETQLRANSYEMLLKAGLTAVSILLVLGLLMNKIVITRIKKLTHATGLLAQRQEVPELQTLEGADELGQLAFSFSRMASRLTTSIEELESQKLYLQDLINSLQDGLIVVDRALRVELVNRSALRVWDHPELQGLRLGYTPLGQEVEFVRGAFRTAGPTHKEVNLTGGGPQTFYELYCSPVCDKNGNVARVIVLFRDVTERKLFEKQIGRTERLASVGQLAAGVAHEINNPMAAITTCAEGLGRYLESLDVIGTDQNEEVKDYLSTIGEAALRCKEITQRLLSLSADDREVDFCESDLGRIVEQVVALVRHESERLNIEIETAMGLTPLVLGDPNKLSQLVLNLILNSIEAIGENGRVVVSVLHNDGVVELTVADNGGGILEKNMDHLFDPFFTTKTRGRGTGLGLSICERIVRQHQGQISFQSAEGTGTQVSVLLPSLEV